MDLQPQIFREYDIRGVVGTELTADTARAIGTAFAAYLEDEDVHGPIAVGRDNRPSGGELHDALVEGLTESGVDVVDVGLVPTPTLYWALEKLAVAGGIQITASHNPPEYNGFKVCVGTKALYGADIQRLLELVQQGRRVRAPSPGRVQDERVLDRYADDIVERIGTIGETAGGMNAAPTGRPRRVVLDCMNGVGALVGPRLLTRLGHAVTCIRCKSDGRFPNGQPDPSQEKNLVALQSAVRAAAAAGYAVDAGIALDGDADRIGVVDSTGAVVWGDRVLAIYARDVLAKPEHAGQPVIFDVKCSQALADAVQAAGGQPVMWKTGHSLIEAKMRELNSPLAGELSGHMYIGDGYYGYDDALYAAARLLRIMATTGRGIAELLAGVPVYPISPEIRVDCPDDRKFGIVDRAVAHWSASHDVITVDGARVQFGDGWGLVRASNTQPALVLRFEARTPERLAAIRDEMATWLRGQDVVF